MRKPCQIPVVCFTIVIMLSILYKPAHCLSARIYIISFAKREAVVVVPLDNSHRLMHSNGSPA